MGKSGEIYHPFLRIGTMCGFIGLDCPEMTKTRRWSGGFSDQESHAEMVLKARGRNNLIGVP